MRAIADVWSKMTDEDKHPWRIAAEQDKQRYEEEMASYDGPLPGPNKRAKKHPDAPKRASSAFLFYSQVMRPRIKAENPDMKNTEISKQLGEAWSKAPTPRKLRSWRRSEKIALGTSARWRNGTRQRRTRVC
ncbi:hypothetical protein PINS_up021840 [Pythium insidiosum]|nr:hypothetical protein PINS_up021840 [Pythium insidiosum]